MEIHCKIGTHPQNILHLKRALKEIKKGDYIEGVPYEEFLGRYSRWKTYLVDDINFQAPSYFYYLSL